MFKWIAVAVMLLALTACGGGADNSGKGNAPVNEPAAGKASAGGLDHADPESVLAAYMRASDAGDAEGIKQTILPGERDDFAGATGMDGPTKYKIVERIKVSANELRIMVQLLDVPERAPDYYKKPMPHILIREQGKWYVSAIKTGMAIMGDD